MNSPYARTIDGVTYIDQTRLWASLNDVPSADKSRLLMKHAGVTAFDEEGYFINKPVVAVVGVGGFAVSFDENTPEGMICINGRVATPAEHMAELKTSRGYAGQITNLNTGNHTPEALDDITTKHGHMSKLRTNIFDFMALGYPAAVEPNFTRWYGAAGLTHIGLATMTRTVAQSEPPYAVMNPSNLPYAQTLRDTVSQMQLAVSKKGLKGEALKDAHEELNGLHSKNAAHAIYFSASLHALHNKMWELAPDSGQEMAFRRVLALLNDQMNHLFPEFFQPSQSYGYEHPAHWQTETAHAKPVIGIVGHSGCGKSTLARTLARKYHGVTFDADRVVEQLYAVGSEAIATLQEVFPEIVVDGAVDKAKIRAMAAADPDKLTQLGKTVAPFVSKRFDDFLAQNPDKTVFVDIPLLLETTIAQQCGALAVLTAPAEIREKRVIARAQGRQADVDVEKVRRVLQESDRKFGDTNTMVAQAQSLGFGDADSKKPLWVIDASGPASELDISPITKHMDANLSLRLG